MNGKPGAMPRLNRVVRGVGRIQNSTGTRSRKELRRLDAIVTKLAERGQLEALRLFKAGKLSPRELVDADREGRLDRIVADRKILAPLWRVLEDWLPDSAPTPISCARYATSYRRLRRVAVAEQLLRESAVVKDLEGLNWRRLRRAWATSDSDWNRMRAMVSAFLTAHLASVHHPFRLGVMEQFPRGEEPEGVMPTATAADLWRLVAATPEHVRPAYVAMAALGAGPKEYLGLAREQLAPAQFTVTIEAPGRRGKTRYRRRTVAVDPRLWEWIERAVPAPLAYRWLNEYWGRAQAATGIKLRMYDLRHLSAQFAGDRGATDRDLTIHLGHSNPAMSHRYSRRAVARTIAGAIADELLGEEVAPILAQVGGVA